MTDEPFTTNRLAQERTGMAFSRWLMAHERTLMSWIRTSLSLITFGFTIFKFLETMAQNGEGHVRENAPRNLGLFMILLGMVLLLFALLQFRSALKRAMATDHGFVKSKRLVSLSVIGGIGVLLVGVFTLLNMFTGFGGF